MKITAEGLYSMGACSIKSTINVFGEEALRNGIEINVDTITRAINAGLPLYWLAVALRDRYYVECRDSEPVYMALRVLARSLENATVGTYSQDKATALDHHVDAIAGMTVLLMAQSIDTYYAMNKEEDHAPST